MTITAFVLSLLGGFLALFQGGCAFLGGGAFSRYDRDMARLGAGGLLIVIAAIAGFVGGGMALAKKPKPARILLAVSSGSCLLACLMGFTDGLLYFFIYLIAYYCARFETYGNMKRAFSLCVETGKYLNAGLKEKYPDLTYFFASGNRTKQNIYHYCVCLFGFIFNRTETKTYLENLSGSEAFRQNETPTVKKVRTTRYDSEDNFLPEIDVPVMSLQEVLKLGLDALKTGDFESADQHFQNALAMNPKSSTAYIGKLMIQLRVKNPNELIAAPVKLEDERLFNLAFEYANPKTRETLKKYVQANRTRLAQRKDMTNG